MYAAVVEWPYKLISRWDTGERWLYDLAADPGESRDLLPERPAIAARLADLLTAWSEVGRGPAGVQAR